MIDRFQLLALFSVCILASCTGVGATSVPDNALQSVPTISIKTPAPATHTSAAPANTLTATVMNPPATPSPNPGTPTLQVQSPTPTFDPTSWEQLPVIPQNISPRMKEIFQKGQTLGANAHAFSKIGDCGSTPSWFLGDFDRGEGNYKLGDHQELQGVIVAFQGSYGRTSAAAKSGFNASSIFAPIWANREICQANESPLACELRENRPAFALITLGSNDIWHPDEFEPQMRNLLDTLLENGIIPILATKADNAEGDGRINATIARLAYEYQVPLWNFWRAVQELPSKGLQEDGVHLTWGPNRFDDPQVMQRAWPVRNLTALQVLDVVWRAVNE